MVASDGNVIVARISMSRGVLSDVLAQTTTTLFKPENTTDQDKAEAAGLVQWLRNTADEWEKDFDREFSNTDAS